MNALVAAGWTVRVTGLVMIILGLLIWVGVATAIVPLHMLLGLVLVVALWAAAGLALRAGVPAMLPGIAIVWGLVVILLGIAQTSILPSDGHVVVQVAHLIFGIVAIGLGEALVTAARRRTAVA
jgi:hypothetical protein